MPVFGLLHTHSICGFQDSSSTRWGCNEGLRDLCVSASMCLHLKPGVFHVFHVWGFYEGLQGFSPRLRPGIFCLWGSREQAATL